MWENWDRYLYDPLPIIIWLYSFLKCINCQVYKWLIIILYTTMDLNLASTQMDTLGFSSHVVCNRVWLGWRQTDKTTWLSRQLIQPTLRLHSSVFSLDKCWEATWQRWPVRASQAFKCHDVTLLFKKKKAYIWTQRFLNIFKTSMFFLFMLLNTTARPTTTLSLIWFLR